MRLRMLVILGILLITASGILLAADNQKARPFYGELSGEASFLPNGVCTGPDMLPVETHSISSGQLTHLGRSIMQTTHCPTTTGETVGGKATITAANGDQLTATYYVSTSVPFENIGDVAIQEGLLKITGGTGRFQGASGDLKMTVFVTYQGLADPSWPIQMVLVGKITY
jgi:hypothetical protein